MSYPLNFAKQKMSEAGFPEYNIKPGLATIPAASSMNMAETNDFNVLVNFFVDSGVANGSIEAENTAIDLNAALLNTAYYKVRFLHGAITIENYGTNTLFVEFLRLIPIVSDQPAS